MIFYFIITLLLVLLNLYSSWRLQEANKQILRKNFNRYTDELITQFKAELEGMNEKLRQQ